MKSVIAIFWFLLFPLLMALMTPVLWFAPAHSADTASVRERKIEVKVLRHPHDDAPSRDQIALTAEFQRRLDEKVARHERSNRISGKLVIYITPEFYQDVPERNQLVLHCPVLHMWYDIPLAGRSLDTTIKNAFKYVLDMIRLSRELDRTTRNPTAGHAPTKARSG